MKFLIIALLLLASLAAVAEEKTVPAPALPEAAQNKLLKAGHALDKANTDLKDLQISWVSLQQQAEELKKKFADAAKASEKAEADYQAEVKSSATAIGIDSAKYSFDREKLTFSPLVSPVPGTPSPEKK